MVRQSTDNRFPWVNWVGLSILLACYLTALFNVMGHRVAESQAQTIRILHWQLELGVRDGLEELIRRFEAAKRIQGQNVRVIQIPITERAYAQYVTTQMIGETAPDLIELGRFPAEFYGRYFLPLSRLILEPNPWIAQRAAELAAQPQRTPDEESVLATCLELADEPWISLFTDGLRQQYNEANQEYYGVGFSQFTVRMFYNRDLFRKVLGHDRPPRSFRELIEACDQLAEYEAPDGSRLIPIAGARDQADMLRARLICSTTADVFRDYDLDYDAWSTQREIVAAILRGWHPKHPKYRAALDMMGRLAAHFPKGFMALGRMDAGFSFVQGRAAMIMSGSWDAQSFIKQIENQPPERRFSIGVLELPLADQYDPEFGAFVAGRVSEANTGTGFAFGITRFSRHEDLCVEFLQFCTTPENNELLNRWAQWIPSVRGAKPQDMLTAFAPNYVGYYGQMNFDTGPRGRMLHEQVYWPLISGEIDYDQYAQNLMADLPSEAAVDWIRSYREQLEALPNRHARRAAYLAATVFGATPEVREINQLKALRSWEALFGYLMARPIMDSILVDVSDDMDRSGHKPPFALSFFNYLRREGF